MMGRLVVYLDKMSNKPYLQESRDSASTSGTRKTKPFAMLVLKLLQKMTQTYATLVPSTSAESTRLQSLEMLLSLPLNSSSVELSLLNSLTKKLKEFGKRTAD